MSRWLRSVNTLLERLDGQVENVVEERAAIQEESEILEGASPSNVGVTGKKDTVLANILAKRGLSFVADDEDEPHHVDPSDSSTQQIQHLESGSIVDTLTKPGDDFISSNDESLTETASSLELDIVHADPESALQEVSLSVDETKDSHTLEASLGDQPSGKIDDRTGGVEVASDEFVGEQKETQMQDIQQPFVPTPIKDDKKITTPNSKADEIVSISGLDANEYKAALAQAREAQKEARTLRRHVVSLNSQLENAEAEIKAQRNELERAAERIEKDRLRNKEEREKEKIRHAEEIKQFKQQHETSLAEFKKRFEQQLEDARQQLRQVEERRMQEGGDWNKELANALEREKDMVRKVAALEDERSTFLSQLSTLQTQQEALGNRLESLTQTAENAMERERDAEDRLDAALSLHARQISQRQARETALERTISELGAALAVARDREIQRLKSQSESSEKLGEEGGPQDAVTLLRGRLESAHNDLETLQGQLAVERQRSEALQNEMRDIARERADEASAAHARQVQYDRQLADMSLTISRLQLMVRDSKKSSTDQGGDHIDGLDDDAKAKQIRNLSEEVVRQREKVSSFSSEVAALKSRLQVALDRAMKAEAALTSSGNAADIYDVIERAPSSGNGVMRRRGGGSSSRRSTHDASYATISSAIKLDGSQGKGSERIGKAIDALDTFSVETGKYLRYNPIARGAFIIYLLLLHLWTFGLFFFQAHVFEPIHGDFGAGAGVAHGPHAMMLQHNTNVAKVASTADEGLKKFQPEGLDLQGTSNPVSATDLPVQISGTNPP